MIRIQKLGFKQGYLGLQYTPKQYVKYQFQPPWFDLYDDNIILHTKEKCWAKAKSDIGTEENHKTFCKYESKFKRIMNEKLRLILH